MSARSEAVQCKFLGGRADRESSNITCEGKEGVRDHVLWPKLVGRAELIKICGLHIIRNGGGGVGVCVLVV